MKIGDERAALLDRVKLSQKKQKWWRKSRCQDQEQEFVKLPPCEGLILTCLCPNDFLDNIDQV